uniref:Aldehyde dehydrogenase domain-containing protein n=1 Tax=Stomoxys calcitrans TaxID=35570 RepID=A0A1I8Q0N5_STOCA
MIFKLFRPNAWKFLRRFSSSVTLECCKVNRSDLHNALKKNYQQPASVPIVIGKDVIYSGDEQLIQMPHNHQRIAAKYYNASRQHIQMAIDRALEVQEKWANTDVNCRLECFQKAVDILMSPLKFAQLMSAIMLAEAKTRQEAERDLGRLIRMMSSTADYLKQLSEFKYHGGTEGLVTKYALRPLEGFVACTGPINTSWRAANLALAPLIMGNVVLWRPPKVCVHSAHLIFSSMMEAGIPAGALQFLPSNYRLFLDTVVRSPNLAGINYDGRLSTLRTLWHDMAIQLANYKCFPRLVGECDSKGYHFVHESADLEKVVDLTISAAFGYSGQRPNCCARLYVPSSMWPQVRCHLEARVACLKISDPTDDESFSSAICRPDIFDDIVEYLKYASNKPTIVLCQNPQDRLLIDDIPGPILSVYVYENAHLEGALETLATTQKFGACGSVFVENEKILPRLLQKLGKTASNLYINNQCSGSSMSHLPLSGNRLSGTNDKNATPYYLLRFAAPQMLEEARGDIAYD